PAFRRGHRDDASPLAQRGSCGDVPRLAAGSLRSEHEGDRMKQRSEERSSTRSMSSELPTLANRHASLLVAVALVSVGAFAGCSGTSGTGSGGASSSSTDTSSSSSTGSSSGPGSGGADAGTDPTSAPAVRA